jgi:hypothetical protein
MKKLIYAAAAIAALVAAGPSFAQSAECQAGSAWGAQPGCDSASMPPSVYGNSGWPPAGAGYTYPYLAQALPQFVTPYAYSVPRSQRVYPSRRDRDGDGVRNSQDRYPDDPRYY